MQLIFQRRFFTLSPPNGSALSCRQGPPPWRTGAPMFDARLYRG
jgi:hypothetical protein